MFNSDLDKKSVLIWDRHHLTRVPDFEGECYLWQSYFEERSKRKYSIPKYLDKNRNRLREKYNSLIYDLGEKRIQKKRIVDWMMIRPGFSYWWMTLIVEGNYGKSSFMTDLVKLLALEEILATSSFDRIEICSDNDLLKSVVRKFCKSKNIKFYEHDLEKPPFFSKSFTIRSLYSKIFYPLQAIVALIRYLYLIHSLRKQTLPEKRIQNTHITFFDYFFHLKLNKNEPFIFKSDYWTILIDFLRNARVKTHWSHIFIPHSLVANSRKALSVLEQFNLEKTEAHSFLEGFIDRKAILKTFFDYCRLLMLSIRIREFSSLCKTELLGFDFWVLIKADFFNSLRGAIAVQNLFFLNSIENCFDNLPFQKLGFYLQENQAWEMALIHVWRKKRYGTLIGVPHATIRFWDLRYFRDRRSFKNAMPMPDLVALNGIKSSEAFLEGRYPKDQIREVEALRYIHILANTKVHRTGNKKKVVRVLILTDYLPGATILQIQTLINALPALERKYEFILKAHPAYPVDNTEFPGLNFTVTCNSLSDLLNEVDIAYTSNITSASLDAFSAGVPVISMLDGTTLNMSPLLGLKNVTFVSDGRELAKALESQSFSPKRIDQSRMIFHLDKELTKWKELLDLKDF
ncbi:carbohydrate biosynthesis protein [Leptospira sp. 201903070]|uniref:Carbohydrate biosynthesis protein n=1 Tax=Leptospira ainlahdjerensis TaxID=2810033 RepID=A0ABS2UAA3_9LEPT|nr:TIGR04326 family surface carbohydrate biosynthesis protein [Leptospira ainlahdjerensis]MBM9577301.1 carbohydrate biosynthesis protein [Leptospira ainlahdjerensis]